MYKKFRSLSGKLIRKIYDKKQKSQRKLIRLETNHKPNGAVLLSFATTVFEHLLAGDPMPRRHPATIQNFNIARAFLDLGFTVDVIWYDNETFVPKRYYDICFDVLSNMERLSKHLDAGCIKIYFPMFAHWTVNNYRSYARQLFLLERRGVALKPERLVKPNLSVENSDYIICKGDDFSSTSYSYLNTPMFQIAQVLPITIDNYVHKNYDKVRRNFIFLSGRGLVHKGLDLVLDAFVQLKNFNLTICGNISQEKAFESLYRKELYETDNIRTIGWIDTTSRKFEKIIANSIGLVHPSASEISCTSVITCMNPGLIPVITFSTDINVEDFGIILKEDRIEALKKAIVELSQRSEKELSMMSNAAYEAAHERYTRTKFLADLRKTLCCITELKPPDIWGIGDDEDNPRINDINITLHHY